MRAVDLSEALADLEDLNLDKLTTGAAMRKYFEHFGEIIRASLRLDDYTVDPITHKDFGYALQMKGNTKVHFEPFGELNEFQEDFVKRWVRGDGSKVKGLVIRVAVTPCEGGDEASSQEGQTLVTIHLPPPRPGPKEPSTPARPPPCVGGRTPAPPPPAAGAPPPPAAGVPATATPATARPSPSSTLESGLAPVRPRPWLPFG